jgi:hypothetical protein
MDTLQAEVYTALTATGTHVDYQFPSDARQIPSISWYESANSVKARADNAEYLTDVAYVIDLWGATPEANATLALSVDTRLAALGLERTFSIDMYEQETQVHHKSMRYRGVIHIAQQKVYQ